MNKFFILLLSFAMVSCSVAQHYSTKNKKAIKLFEMGKQAPALTIDPTTNGPNFRSGIDYMNKALEKDPNFWEAHMFAGEFAEMLGDYPSAIDHYRKALAINPNHSTTGSTYFYLANLEQAIGDYDNAMRNIDLFERNPNANPELLVKARQIRSNCEFAKKAMQNPIDFNPINIGPGINTEDPEYFPTITVDGRTILFTRRIADGRVSGNFKEQEDFFVSQLGNNNIWGKAEPMPANVNTVNNEGAPTIAPDGRTLVFVGCPDASGEYYGENRTGKGSCDLFLTKKLGNRWMDPVNLPGNVNSFHWETQPSLSSDGKTMYFIRGIRGRDMSNNADIYVTRLQPNGQWGTPERLPDHINTPEQEESVLIHPDGRTLYFASRGHVGMGGSDLYVTRMDENGNWSKPENLGYPINTKFDENSLMVSPDGEIAFFASDRDGGYGDLDIYYFIMPEHLRPVKTLYFEGIVFDATTRNPIPGKFQLIDLETGKEVIYSEADKISGEFMVSLPVNREYALNVSYPGYTFFSQNFNMRNPENLEAIHMDVPMVPIVSEQPILLANVFFDLNKSTLRKESFVELNKLVEFLESNPKVKIEIGGHTDSRGSNNKELSTARAKSVYDYVISKGIDASRLSYKGYGETKPVYSDEYINGLSTEKEKEAAHQANRRTEYKIVK
ncbi:MAG: tetratricopeptide repeat protein [Bacteroidetes bacterium]|nr:MAG: tetratricopeptide repeat protein [Bacteroidota bacterium]